MPRKKKTEVIEEKEAVKEIIKKVDYGTGWNRVNNMLQAGFTLEEIRGGTEK